MSWKIIKISQKAIYQPQNNTNIHEIITEYDSKKVPNVGEKHGIRLIDGLAILRTSIDVFEFY